jgi:hypothetical protein
MIWNCQIVELSPGQQFFFKEVSTIYFLFDKSRVSDICDISGADLMGKGGFSPQNLHTTISKSADLRPNTVFFFFFGDLPFQNIWIRHCWDGISPRLR